MVVERRFRHLLSGGILLCSLILGCGDNSLPPRPERPISAPPAASGKSHPASDFPYEKEFQICDPQKSVYFSKTSLLKTPLFTDVLHYESGGWVFEKNSDGVLLPSGIDAIFTSPNLSSWQLKLSFGSLVPLKILEISPSEAPPSQICAGYDLRGISGQLLNTKGPDFLNLRAVERVHIFIYQTCDNRLLFHRPDLATSFNFFAEYQVSNQSSPVTVVAPGLADVLNLDVFTQCQ